MLSCSCMGDPLYLSLALIGKYDLENGVGDEGKLFDGRCWEFEEESS